MTEQKRACNEFYSDSITVTHTARDKQGLVTKQRDGLALDLLTPLNPKIAVFAWNCLVQTTVASLQDSQFSLI